MAAEGSLDEHTAGDSKFNVAEVLDPYPGGGAEQDQDEADVRRPHGTERQDGKKAGNSVQGEGDLARSESLVEQAVVNMTAVGGEDGLLAEEAADDGQGGVQQRDGQGDHGRGHAEDSGRLFAPQDSIASQQEADQQAAGVAQENCRRVEVVTQESEQCAGERNGCEGHWYIFLQQRGQQHGDGCKESHAGSESIDAVDEVEHVGAGEQPYHRDWAPKPAI